MLLKIHYLKYHPIIDFNIILVIDSNILFDKIVYFIYFMIKLININYIYMLKLNTNTLFISILYLLYYKANK